MTDRYRCSNCGHICTEGEMGSNYMYMGDGEAWSNWICPKCERWHPAPDDAEASDIEDGLGWEKVEQGDEKKPESA